MPGPNEYDQNGKESAMHILKVRNDELIDSITKQAAERGITYAAIVALTDVEPTYRVPQRVCTGRMNINNSFIANPDAPIGGYKHSGMGREDGLFGITEFTNAKGVTGNAGGS